MSPFSYVQNLQSSSDEENNDGETTDDYCELPEKQEKMSSKSRDDSDDLVMAEILEKTDPEKSKNQNRFPP